MHHSPAPVARARHPPTRRRLQPGSLTATRQSASSVGLSWSAAGDNVGVTEYRVHRSTTAGFTPSAANRIATVSSGTSYQDSGAAAGTYYYRVVAADGSGNVGPASNQAIGDLQGPTVSITAPAAGATVSNTATVTASATDTVGVQSVQLRVDGVDVGRAGHCEPVLDPLEHAVGDQRSHTLTVVARDAAGNTTTSASRTVTVANIARIAGYGFEEAWAPPSATAGPPIPARSPAPPAPSAGVSGERCPSMG